MKQHPYRKQALPVDAPPTPPAGSRIRVSEGSKDLTFRWAPLRPTRERGTDTVLIFCLFLGPFLALLGADWLVPPEYSREFAFQFYRAVCLLGWIIVGMPVCRALVYALRPAPPERIVLTAEHLSYLPSDDGPELRVPWGRVPVKLAKSGKHRRLLVARGAHWVEVAKDLSDPERAWLADTIAKWADSHAHR